MNGNLIPNAAQSGVEVYNATAANAGTYTVTLTNAAGTVTSAGAIVTVGPSIAPAFVSSPASQAVPYGQYFSLGFQVRGSQPITYQWYLNGVQINGATGSSFGVESATSANAGNYTVVATNAAGSTISAAATVTVGSVIAPTITAEPISLAVAGNQVASLNVAVVGSSPLTYQWSLNGVALPGQTQSSLNIYGFSGANAGTYTVTVANSQGSVTSAPASLSLQAPASTTPVFTTQPGGNTVWAGQSVNLGVAVLCSAPSFSFQWYLNGTAIPGATSTYYDIAHASPSDAGTYTCVCTAGAQATTSMGATLTVLSAMTPVFTEQPVGESLNTGDSMILTSEASGSPAPVYQWYFDGAAIPNATYANYSVNAVDPTYAGTYTVVATNGGGSTTSASAVVTVAAPVAPTITQQPVGLVYEPGTYPPQFTLTVGATGPQLSYQWAFNGSPIPGAGQSQYQVYDPVAGDGGNYTVTVSNTAGTVTSSIAVVVIAPVTAPVLLSDPASLTIPMETYQSLQVGATEGGPTGIDTYQWYLNGTAISGATSFEFELDDTVPSQSGSYTVTVTNSAGSVTSTAAQVEVVPPPTMTAGPQNVTAIVGTPASFTVTAASETPEIYQWYCNGSALSDGGVISGSESSTLRLSSVSAANLGTYYCNISNFGGTTTTNNATLALGTGDAPQIVSITPNQTVAIGSSLSLTVSASGTPPPTYQWALNGNPIANATSATYSVASVSAANAGTYTVEVTNPVGSVSATCVVEVPSPPVFSQQPASVQAVAGGSATFSATAAGTPAPTYQWFFDGTAIPGATGTTYPVGSVASGNAGTYTVTASNSAGTVTSQAATLTIGSPPVFTQQLPASIAINLGAPYVMFSTASGVPAPTYQWYFNGQAIAGANNSFYNFNAAQIANSGSYTVVATNANGSVTSTPTIVVVNGATGVPTLANQPAPQTIAVGDSVVFSVSLSGVVTAAARADAPSGSANYQWFLNGVALSGATGPSLLIQDATAANAGTYTCLVTTSTGSVLSSGADLSVQSTQDDGRLINISALAEDAPGSNVSMGFVSGRGGPSAGEPLLVRVSGPALQEFNVAGFLTDPQLDLFNNKTSALVSGNAGWASTLTNQLAVAAMDAQVGAFPLTNVDSADSALVATLASGPYSVQASSRSGLSGKVLAEVYDATAAYTPNVTPRLINVSCLQNIAANGTMTVGFTMGGQTARTVLIRADGPSLTTVGVNGVMPDPTLTLFSGPTATQSNAGWGGDAAIAQAAQMEGAFALSGTASLDSAVLVSLAPGLYTVQVSSASGTAGWVLVEVYEVP
ncbi:MAG TPA: immunoglobulin domain-containing protein [Opitutaceae bacterium]|nr:immunoglobulin domain-containing protein [Opitutaceae bacterium]